MSAATLYDWPSARFIAEMRSVPHAVHYLWAEKPTGHPVATALVYRARGAGQRWLGTVDYTTTPATVHRPAA
jgi:hypothetical protein